jgi:hypothetical protein
MTMKRYISILLSITVACVLVAIEANGQTNQRENEKVVAADPIEKTLEGELVGLRCFMTRGAKGEAHQGCATACANRGLPIGVLDATGPAYTLLVTSPAYSDYMAKMVRITGMVKGQTMAPKKMEVKEGDSWKEVKLSKEMM